MYQIIKKFISYHDIKDEKYTIQLKSDVCWVFLEGGVPQTSNDILYYRHVGDRIFNRSIMDDPTTSYSINNQADDKSSCHDWSIYVTV
jgi:hypothetical protein